MAVYFQSEERSSYSWGTAKGLVGNTRVTSAAAACPEGRRLSAQAELKEGDGAHSVRKYHPTCLE